MGFGIKSEKNTTFSVCSAKFPFLKSQTHILMKIEKKLFGHFDNQPVELISLSNANGFLVKVMPYGATLVSIFVPDKSGKLKDCLIGFDTFDEFLTPHPCMGVVVGRYANRLKNGIYHIDNQEFKTSINWKSHTLHGGNMGFDKKLWKIQSEEMMDDKIASVQFFYWSKDGEEGFGGNLKTTVTYSITEDNELKINYEAQTDKSTVINLTNHAYFNLANSGGIENHFLQLNADKFTEADEDLIPTGKLKSVKNTALDFINPKKIGQGIRKNQGGFDDNFCINQADGTLRKAAELFDPESGRVMETWTTEAGIQVFTLNFDGSTTGKGQNIKGYFGVCLETQNYPDAPNQPDFPNAILRPDETFRSETIYQFKVK